MRHRSPLRVPVMCGGDSEVVESIVWGVGGGRGWVGGVEGRGGEGRVDFFVLSSIHPRMSSSSSPMGSALLTCPLSRYTWQVLHMGPSPYSSRDSPSSTTVSEDGDGVLISGLKQSIPHLRADTPPVPCSVNKRHGNPTESNGREGREGP